MMWEIFSFLVAGCFSVVAFAILITLITFLVCIISVGYQVIRGCFEGEDNHD